MMKCLMHAKKLINHPPCVPRYIFVHKFGLPHTTTTSCRHVVAKTKEPTTVQKGGRVVVVRLSLGRHMDNTLVGDRLTYHKQQ